MQKSVLKNKVLAIFLAYLAYLIYNILLQVYDIVSRKKYSIYAQIIFYVGVDFNLRTYGGIKTTIVP